MVIIYSLFTTFSLGHCRLSWVNNPLPSYYLHPCICSLYVHHTITIYNIQPGTAVASARYITRYPAIIYIPVYVHYMFTIRLLSICLLYIHHMFNIYSLYTTFSQVQLLPQLGKLPATWLLSTSLDVKAI